MSIWKLIRKEIAYRRLNFGLGLLSVLVAVGVLVACLTLLRGHELRNAAAEEQKQQRLQQAFDEMEDDFRKITKNMGFNVLILPEGQNLSDFYARGYASTFMPESYAQRLVDSKIVTIRHLLPMLEQRVDWEEQRRMVILIGIRGEVPMPHLDPRKPMLSTVDDGHAVLGYELWNSLDLAVGDEIVLNDETFIISQCKPQVGNKDDISIWIPLSKAQAMLGREGMVTGILALECECALADLPKVREEIMGILPGTQVLEETTKALARAEARQRAYQTRVDALEAEAADRQRLQNERAALASWLVPLVVGGSVVWIGLLAFGNVRERTGEIGLLRAVGVSGKQIFLLFMSRAMLIGVVGAAMGYGAGFLAAMQWTKADVLAVSAGSLFTIHLPIMCLAFSPMLAALASWLPATVAARQDPAEILRDV